MKRLVVLFLIPFSCALYAQNYTRDAGVRIGENLAFSYRQYLNENQASEFMAAFGWRGINLAAAKVFAEPTLSGLSDNLFFLYGFGAHVGFRYIDKYRIGARVIALDEYRFAPHIGVDGLIGLEYRIAELPLVFGLDTRPTFEFSTLPVFRINLLSMGFALRYKF